MACPQSVLCSEVLLYILHRKTTVCQSVPHCSDIKSHLFLQTLGSTVVDEHNYDGYVGKYCAWGSGLLAILRACSTINLSYPGSMGPGGACN